MKKLLLLLLLSISISAQRVNPPNGGNGGGVTFPTSASCIGTDSSAKPVVGTCNVTSATNVVSIVPGFMSDGSAMALATTIPVTNAVVGSNVSVTPNPILPSGVLALGHVYSSGTVTVELVNLSGGPQNIISTAFTVAVGVSAISGPTSGTVSSGTIGQFGYYSSSGTTVVGHTLVAGDIPALNYQAPMQLQTNGSNLTSEATVNYQNSAATNGLTLIFTNPSAGNVQLGITGMGTTNFAATALNEVCTITFGAYGCGYQVNGSNAHWQDGNSNLMLGISNMPTTLTSGTRNIGVGGGVMNTITSGNHNVGVGATAIRGCTTCASNVGIGDNSLFGGTTSFNAVVGASAMASATGSSNACLGYFCLAGGSNSASSNAVMGALAGSNISTGNSDACIGANCLITTATGSLIFAAGLYSGSANYNGSNNVYLGAKAGLPQGTAPVALTGTSNSTTTVTFASTTGFVVGMNFYGPGVQDGTTISTVNVNTSLVLSLATTTNGSNIYYAAANASVSGSNNTYLGYLTGLSSAVQHTFQTVIGATATASCDNCIVLGTVNETVKVTSQCFSQLATDGTTVMFQSVTNVGVATWSSTKPSGCN